MNKNRMECKFCLWRAITVAMCVLVLLCTLAYFVFFDRCQTVKLKSGAVVCLRDRWIRYKGIGQFGRAEIRNPDKMSASELWQVATRYCLFEYGYGTARRRECFLRLSSGVEVKVRFFGRDFDVGSCNCSGVLNKHRLHRISELGCYFEELEGASAMPQFVELCLDVETDHCSPLIAFVEACICRFKIVPMIYLVPE